ncbi:MAG: hypothetical protein ACYC3F_07180 [Gemmatimonadaceae bacterium]
MHGSSSRSLTAGLRTGFFVLGAVMLLALTPRPASAASLICVLGQCQLAPGGCALYTPLPSMYTCTATVAMQNPRLVREGRGASVIVAGKPVPIVSDELIAIFDRWGNKIPPKNDPTFKTVDLSYTKACDAAFHATNRTVSEERLASIGRELKLPIPPMRSR